MVNYEIEADRPKLGGWVRDYADSLVDAANNSGKCVGNKFNNTEIYAKPGETVDEVVRRWYMQRDEDFEAYKKTPEYAEQQRKNAIAEAEFNDRMNRGFIEADNLDFTDIRKTMEFIAKYGYDLEFHASNSAFVVQKLKDAGYVANENTGPDIRPEDPVNVARYIFGQILSMNCFHGMAVVFAERWLQDFPDYV